MSLQALADKYDATIVKTLIEIKDVDDSKHIALQTPNFKIIISPKNKSGFRTIVAKE